MVLDCRGSREWVAVLIWTTGLLATRLQIVHIQWPEFAITLLTFKLFLFEFYILQKLGVGEGGGGEESKSGDYHLPLFNEKSYVTGFLFLQSVGGNKHRTR